MAIRRPLAGIFLDAETEPRVQTERAARAQFRRDLQFFRELPVNTPHLWSRGFADGLQATATLPRQLTHLR